jgi:hypothetical protein
MKTKKNVHFIYLSVCCIASELKKSSFISPCTTYNRPTHTPHQLLSARVYECASKSFRTGRLERELQMISLSATRWSCIAILWVSKWVYPLCCFSTSVYCCKRIFRNRLSPETFVYILVDVPDCDSCEKLCSSAWDPLRIFRSWS